MIGEVLRVLVFAWVLFGAHEQEVFAKVSEALKLLGIAEVSNADVHGGTRLVGLRILNDERFQAIGQTDEAVSQVILGRYLKIFGENGILSSSLGAVESVADLEAGR